jgi:hypothetical protein
MKWTISVFVTEPDGGERLIFAAQTSLDEVRDLAHEARRHDPRLQIFLKSPTGQVTIWP